MTTQSAVLGLAFALGIVMISGDSHASDSSLRVTGKIDSKLRADLNFFRFRKGLTHRHLVWTENGLEFQADSKSVVGKFSSNHGEYSIAADFDSSLVRRGEGGTLWLVIGGGSETGMISNGQQIIADIREDGGKYLYELHDIARIECHRTDSGMWCDRFTVDGYRLNRSFDVKAPGESIYVDPRRMDEEYHLDISLD